MKQEKNGFTLIELLAVIVVLAVLVLFAMPAVTNSSERAKRSTFATEASEIIGVAETTYEELSMSGASYQKMCLPIRGMVAAGYLTKTVGNLSENTAYQGSILIDMTSGTASYSIWLENGSYSLIGAGTGFKGNNVKAVDQGTYTENVNKCGGQGTIPDPLKKDVKYTTDPTTKKAKVEVVDKTW